jgi:hypothetical protein
MWDGGSSSGFVFVCWLGNWVGGVEEMLAVLPCVWLWMMVTGPFGSHGHHMHVYMAYPICD